MRGWRGAAGPPQNGREKPSAEALAEFSAQARALYGARKPLREAPTAEVLAEQAGGEALALALARTL